MRVLPENPPGTFFLGDLHILDYFAEVSARSQCGLLLDCAHLAMFQRLRGLPPTAGLDGFPLERVVELHVAGGTIVDVEGLELIDDAHDPEPLPDTWQILEAVLPRAPNVSAIVYECEKNAPDEVIANFPPLERDVSLVSRAASAGAAGDRAHAVRSGVRGARAARGRRRRCPSCHPSLQAQLAAIDPRALCKLDRLLRQRTPAHALRTSTRRRRRSFSHAPGSWPRSTTSSARVPSTTPSPRRARSPSPTSRISSSARARCRVRSPLSSARSPSARACSRRRPTPARSTHRRAAGVGPIA